MTNSRISKYEIEVLTPVHIGTGKTYSPLEHYAEEGKLIRLDFYRICEDPEFERNRDSITNAILLRETLMEVAPALAKRYPLYAIDNLGVKKDSEVKEVIKTCGRPYIPGSSIKGAILTGILVRKIREGKISIREEDLINKKSKKRGAEIIRELTEKLGGGSSNRWIRVTDSECFEFSRDLAAGEIAILPRGPKIFMEFLKPGARATFEIEQLSERDVGESLKDANEFYRLVLEKENQWLQRQGLQKLDFEKTGYLLRLGSGSSKLATSISILLDTELRFNSEALRHPKTRKVVESLKTTMGWVMIRKK